MITPDTKDWTWVLDRPCPECGFDARTCAPEDVAELVREDAAAWRRLVDAGDIDSVRPAPDTWSSLEYACHVRDVYRRYDERIELMLNEDDPLFPNWDQDATAIEDRYNEQQPEAVVEELVRAATRLAAGLDDLSTAQWDRPGRRSDGASFSVASMVRYMVHDPIHHRWDVARGRPTGG